jgi:hypothetical protein
MKKIISVILFLIALNCNAQRGNFFMWQNTVVGHACQRPSGLTEKIIYLSANGVDPYPTFDAAAEDLFRYATGQGLYSGYRSTSSFNFAVNDSVYDGNITGDCTKIADGYYYYAENTSLNDKVYHIVSGIIVSKTTILTIGANLGGGKLAYILVPGDTGYDPSIVHGIIATSSDQSSGINWYNGTYTTTGATATDLGTGNANTNTIVSAQGSGSYAAKICYDLVVSIYSDWYLPSINELTKVYIYRAVIGNFNTSGTYWSSTETSSNNANSIYFLTATINNTPKNNIYNVRAIRSF